MEQFFTILANNIFVRILMVAVFLDCFLGAGRAIKEKAFNSCFGIDGGIRKVCMIGSVLFLLLVDAWTNFNFLFLLPEQVSEFIPISKLGLCEFFCILFILFESVSILKNMLRCGLPIPGRLKILVERMLNSITNELETDELKAQKIKNVNS